MNKHHHSGELMNDYSKPATLAEYARLFFSGFAMGASDIVPGVSGGTMAFILGVYETLIDAIKSFNMKALQMGVAFITRRGRTDAVHLTDLLDHLHLRFLFPLGFGLLTAVFLLSSLLESWLHDYPTYVFSFFGGLIIASVVAVAAKVRWSTQSLVFLLTGIVAAYIIVGLPSLGSTLGHHPMVLLISGAIAICAMILPGISGSFILLILGQYDFILGAVKDRDIMSLLSVAAGAAVGIIGFSRVLSWLLNKHENNTIAILVGFMIGSLRLVIQRAVYTQDEAGLATPVMFDFGVIGVSFGLILIGFLLVSAIDHMQTKKNPILSLISGSRRKGNS